MEYKIYGVVIEIIFLCVYKAVSFFISNLLVGIRKIHRPIIYSCFTEQKNRSHIINAISFEKFSLIFIPMHKKCQFNLCASDMPTNIMEIALKLTHTHLTRDTFIVWSENEWGKSIHFTHSLANEMKWNKAIATINCEN